MEFRDLGIRELRVSWESMKKSQGQSLHSE